MLIGVQIARLHAMEHVAPCMEGRGPNLAFFNASCKVFVFVHVTGCIVEIPVHSVLNNSQPSVKAVPFLQRSNTSRNPKVVPIHRHIQMYYNRVF